MTEPNQASQRRVRFVCEAISGCSWIVFSLKDVQVSVPYSRSFDSKLRTRDSKSSSDLFRDRLIESWHLRTLKNVHDDILPIFVRPIYRVLFVSVLLTCFRYRYVTCCSALSTAANLFQTSAATAFLLRIVEDDLPRAATYGLG